MKDGHPQEPGRRLNRLRGRGKAAAGAVGSDGIVLAPPLLDQHGRLRQRVEDLPVQQLVPELAVEALVVAPFSHGLPGSIKSISTPTRPNHRRTSFAVNSGPLSDLRYSGGPCRTNRSASTHSGVRQKTRRVTNWKNGAMALRWAAASFVETEKSYRRIIGYDQLWMLRAHLDDHEPVAEMRKAG